MDEAKYSVRGYSDHHGYDCESPADTIKEARQRARYYMSHEFMRTCESTTPIIYVEIVDNRTNETVADFGSM